MWWAVSLVDAQPFQGKKKGADGGIDGMKFFGDYQQDKQVGDKDAFKTCKIIVNVKGGENVGPTMVKDLIATVGHEKAEMGLFITLANPTKAMTTLAVSAGYYTDGSGRKFPRIQILTIEDLLSGQARAEHPDHKPDLNFKKAKKEASGKQAELF